MNHVKTMSADMTPIISRVAVSLTVGAALLCGQPASAQMDWLSPHLDAQRFNNMRRAQQQGIESSRKRQVKTPCTAQPDPARRAALRRKLEPEYYRRVKFHGRVKADAWLKKVAFEAGRQEGVEARRRCGAR